MPIDPNIALSAQVPQMPNIGQSLVQGQQLALQRQQMLALQQERAAQTQEIQQKLQAQQRLQQQQSTVDGLMKNAFTPDPDTGAMLFNRNVFQQGLVQANLGHLYPELSESLDKMENSAVQANLKKRDMVAQTMWGIKQAGSDPGAALMGLSFLKANQAISPEHEQAIHQALAQNPGTDTVNSLIDHYAGYLPEYQSLKEKYATSQADLAKTQAQTAQANAAANKDVAGTAQQQRQNDASLLASATSAADYASKLANLPSDRQAAFPPAQAWNKQTPLTLVKMGMSPEQLAQNSLGWAQLAETKRKNDLEIQLQDPKSPKNQEKMEQQYAQLLKSELLPSGRSGMGTEDKKVNQAAHLIAMFDQNKDAQGNYNIPKAQYAELATGLATLVSPNATPTDSMRSEIETRTAKGDLAGIGTYLTGTPMTGSTQDVFKMLRDSIVRQGTVAQKNRDNYANGVKALAPSDLDPARKARLEQSYLNLTTIPSGATGPSVGETRMVNGQMAKWDGKGWLPQ